MTKITQLKFVLIFAVCGFCFFSPAARSAGDTSLVLQPDKIEIKALAGEKVKNQFLIVNRGNLPVRLKLVPEDFKVIDEQGNLEFFIATDTQAVSQWLVPQFLEIFLGPLQSKEISFITSLPPDAASGTHNGAILFEAADDKTPAIKNNFGEQILVTVIGSGQERATTGGQITKFTTSGFSQPGQINIRLGLKNLGNAYLKTRGIVSIKDWLGRDVASTDAGQQIVYSASSRVFSWRWDKALPIGFYRAQMLLTNANKTEQQFNATSWFVVFPWQTAIYVVGILLLLLLVWFKERIMNLSRAFLRMTRNKFAILQR